MMNECREDGIILCDKEINMSFMERASLDHVVHI
jgi:hypothetical protein